MADVRTLRIVVVSDGAIVDELRRDTDGTVTPGRRGGVAAGVLASEMRAEELDAPAAFAHLAATGWTNGNLMIAIADLDR